MKTEDFYDFCKIVKLVQNKAHLTEKGLEEIRVIRSKMNTGRKFD